MLSHARRTNVNAAITAGGGPAPHARTRQPVMPSGDRDMELSLPVDQTVRTCAACGPFGPWVTLYSTFWFSSSVR